LRLGKLQVRDAAGISAFGRFKRILGNVALLEQRAVLVAIERGEI
jgi:hypothetical protein